MVSLNDGSAHSAGAFEASDLAKWFHASPHRDFQFDDTTTIFTPSNKSYNEALFFLAICIASCGMLLFILLILFYMCIFFTCKKAPRLPSDTYHSRKTCFQNIIVIMGLTCSMAIIVGFVFNGQASDGVDHFRNAVDEIQTNINDASSMGNELRTTLQDANNLIVNLEDTSGLPTARTANIILTDNVLGSLKNLNDLLPVHVSNDGSNFGDKVHRYDNYRWLVTVSVFTWCLFLCVFSFWIRCQTTGCIMMMLTMFSFSSMVLTWVVMGADFGIATGMGDFCVNPGTSIKNMTNRNIASDAVIDYYLTCGVQYNPFANNMVRFEDNLGKVTTIIQQIHESYPQYVTLTVAILKDLQNAKNHFSMYQAYFACPRIHGEYMDAMDGLCNTTLFGMALVILSLLIVGFLSGLVTCCICPLWGYRKSYHLAYPNVEANVGDDGVLWWPDGPDGVHDNLEYPPVQQRPNDVNTEHTLLIGHQPHSNYDTVNRSSFRPNTNEATTRETPSDRQENFYETLTHSF